MCHKKVTNVPFLLALSLSLSLSLSLPPSLSLSLSLSLQEEIADLLNSNFTNIGPQFAA